jgi:hypothetical protein
MVAEQKECQVSQGDYFDVWNSLERLLKPFSFWGSGLMAPVAMVHLLYSGSLPIDHYKGYASKTAEREFKPWFFHEDVRQLSTLLNLHLYLMDMGQLAFWYLMKVYLGSFSTPKGVYNNTWVCLVSVHFMYTP